jgi:hypothetical protein
MWRQTVFIAFYLTGRRRLLTYTQHNLHEPLVYNNNNNNNNVVELFVNCVTNTHLCLLLIIILPVITRLASQDTSCNWNRKGNVVLDFGQTYAFVETSILLSMGHPRFAASRTADTLKRKQVLMFIVSE